MTREEAITILNMVEAHGSLVIQAKDMAIKALEYDDAKYHEEHGEVIVDKAVWEDAKRALEQKPSGDAVSRQDAYKCLEIHGDYNTLNEVYERLEKLPSVNPQPKTGHWINNRNGTYECDRCGKLHSRSNFCPNCGCRMVEPQESEVNNG